eukprot:2297587-Rhodomonas_salina.1
MALSSGSLRNVLRYSRLRVRTPLRPAACPFQDLCSGGFRRFFLLGTMQRHVRGPCEQCGTELADGSWRVLCGVRY